MEWKLILLQRAGDHLNREEKLKNDKGKGGGKQTNSDTIERKGGEGRCSGEGQCETRLVQHTQLNGGEEVNEKGWGGGTGGKPRRKR